MGRAFLVTIQTFFKSVFFLGAFLGAIVLAKGQMILERGNGTEPQDVDPHIVTGIPESHIIEALFEGLIQVDPKTTEPIPGVAKSWEVSKDQLTYVFKLRKNAKWTNGDPVTAHDFVYSWQRLLAPKTAARYAYQGYYLKNGEAYNKGKLKDPNQVGVKAVDDFTLKVMLAAPTPFFLGLLYHHSMAPVHKKTVEKYGQRWTRPENIVSNGPFKMKSWEINKVVKVVKNPLYWDASIVKLDGVNFWAFEQDATDERMFRAKKIHMTNGVPIEKIPYWQKTKTGVYQQHPYLGTYYYRFNTTRKPFNDKRVRKALALAIDREKMVKYVTRAGQLPGTTFTPPGTAGYSPTPRLPVKAQVKEAQKLLAEAGYPGGKGFPKFEILYNTLESHKKIAEAIQQMWKKNLGINVSLFNQEWKVYLTSVQTMNYAVARAGWIGDYNDPMTFLDMWVTDGGNNETGWSNKKYDSLIAKATKERDKTKRLKAFQQAEDILLDELPVLPIYIYTRVYLKDTVVKGWHPNVQDWHPLKFVSLASK